MVSDVFNLRPYIEAAAFASQNGRVPYHQWIIFCKKSGLIGRAPACNLDPSLEAPCFQTLIGENDDSAFNLKPGLLSELALPLHIGKDMSIPKATR